MSEELERDGIIFGMALDHGYLNFKCAESDLSIARDKMKINQLLVRRYKNETRKEELSDKMIDLKRNRDAIANQNIDECKQEISKIDEKSAEERSKLLRKLCSLKEKNSNLEEEIFRTETLLNTEIPKFNRRKIGDITALKKQVKEKEKLIDSLKSKDVKHIGFGIGDIPL